MRETEETIAAINRAERALRNIRIMLERIENRLIYDDERNKIEEALRYIRKANRLVVDVLTSVELSVDNL